MNPRRRERAPINIAKLSGQTTLQSMFGKAQPEKRPVPEMPSTCKSQEEDAKRRRIATDSLAKQLGDGVEVPASASLEELENLAAALTGNGSTNAAQEQSLFVEGEILVIE